MLYIYYSLPIDGKSREYAFPLSPYLVAQILYTQDHDRATAKRGNYGHMRSLCILRDILFSVQRSFTRMVSVAGRVTPCPRFDDVP
jgi:hypothetical protein